MTLTIDLTPTEEANLSAAARQAGLDPTVMSKRLTMSLSFSEVAAAVSQGGFAPEKWIQYLFRGMQAPVSQEERLVAEYHALIDQEDGGDLSDAQAARLRQVEVELDALEDQDSTEQAADRRLQEAGDKLDEILTLLRSLPRKEARQ